MGSDRTAAVRLKRPASQRRPPTADCRSAMVSHGRRHAGLPDAGIAATDQAFNPVPVAVCQSALAASAAVVLPGVAITFTVAADQIGREFRQAIESPPPPNGIRWRRSLPRQTRLRSNFAETRPYGARWGKHRGGIRLPASLAAAREQREALRGCHPRRCQ